MNNWKKHFIFFSPQQLALGCTLVLSFFCNMMAMAQVEVNLDLGILQSETGENSIVGVLRSPNQTSPTYTFNITITDCPSNVSGITIDFGNGQNKFINLSGATIPIQETCSVSYNDSNSKLISATLVNSFNEANWSMQLLRFPHRGIESSLYQTPDETVAVSGINMHIKYAPSNTQHYATERKKK